MQRERAVSGDGNLRFIESAQRADHKIDVLHTGCFIGGMHGQLRQTDVDRVHGNLRVGNAAQRRKQRFREFGLNSKNLVPALLLSLLCCVPEFLYYFMRGSIHSWCPFQAVNTTPEVLASTFPQNVLGFLITAIFWGFFEGFNYVVIRDKISAYYPSKYRFFDWGALVCAIMCILIHGAVGVTPEAILEMLSTFILIYGMLLVRKETGNAWGCILIFFVYWNAF